MQEEERFVVGAQGPSEPQRAHVIFGDEPVADPLESADGMIGNRLAQAECPGPFCQALDKRRGTELAPVVNDQRVFSFWMRKENHECVDILPRAIDDGEEEGRAGDVGDLSVPAQVVRILAGKVETAVGDANFRRGRGGHPVVFRPI